MSSLIYNQVLAGLYGLLIGSFLNVVIYRLPLGLSVVRPRSSCPKCKHQIRWYENIPIVSYLALRGRCSNCQSHISMRYPLIELVVGAFFFSRAPMSLQPIFLYTFILEIIIFCIFLAIFMIDIDHHIIPDSLNIILAIIFIIHSLVQGQIFDGLIGGGVAFLFTFGFTYLFYKIRGVVGLGGGDIKLFSALGIHLGLQGIIYNIFMSCFVGAIVGIFLLISKKINADRPFAFGPAIVVVSSIQILYPEIFKTIIMMVIP